ncbi:predicted protein [Naegleria gruberi]|uniref:Predicted protein n=1 Tax=Naegleria gruberi TaxID=5762 RepID=D2VMH6_NAEGR|nr:uncharacterized protein NAEGRDRAFT_70139 [Naegleria gruberi]EFC42061.1 predicted protein [Naegleria gruberi]|eukprot:XP_002674805.1 predicted protein [Naegleria gruberi strain NEG-M]
MQHDQTMITTISTTSNHLYKLLDLPSEILELLFSFIPFRESSNFRVTNRQLVATFLNYFRRVFREYLTIYNEHLIDKFQLIDCDDEYRERYQQEFERVETELNCKIPFIIKELLMMTRHFDEDMNVASYSYYSYPAHWIYPIKLWEKTNNLVSISDNIVLVPNGKYNNLVISTSGHYNTKTNIWDALFDPPSSMFTIEADSFQKYCKIACGRQIFNRLPAGVTSTPLALCLLKHFTARDLSPQQIAKTISAISPKFNDPDFLVKAAKIYYKIGKEIPQSFLEDRDFCLRLVNSHGKMLKYCTKFLQDKQVVTQAVKQNGFAIKYLSSNFLRNHQELLEIAVSSKPYSLEYIPYSTPGFRKLVIKGINQIEDMTSFPAFLNQEELLQDKEIVEMILMKNPSLITYLPAFWKDCRPLAKKLFAINPQSIVNFSTKVTEDPRIVKMIADTKPSLFLQFRDENNSIQSKVLQAWGLPPFTYQNYEENMEKILELARKQPDIYAFVLGSQILSNYCDMEVRKKWCRTFLKEGIAHNSQNIGHSRAMEIVSLFDVKQQEEVLQWFLVNPTPVSTYFFYRLNKELLVKYAPEAFKKGVPLSDSIPVLVTNPEDIVACFTKCRDCSLVCLDEETYNSKKQAYFY